MMRTIVLFSLLGLVIGGAAGTLFGREPSDGGRGVGPVVDRGMHAAATAPPPAQPADADLASATSPAETPPAQTDGALDRDMTSRAERVRAEARALFEGAEATARKVVTREFLAERALLAEVGLDDPIELLTRLEKSRVVPRELVLSRERFATLFARRTDGSVVDGPTVDADLRLADGETVRFPPGVHALDETFWTSQRPLPRDLVIEGHGMDETLLWLHPRGRISDGYPARSLTFRDLTIHCADSPLHVSNKGFTLRLEGCRVIGFDRGAGGMGMLTGRYGALFATGCRFEAGWGNAPIFAELFQVSGPFVARIEDTLIRGPLMGLWVASPGECVVFARCRFVDMDRSRTQQLDQGVWNAVRLIDCAVEYLPEDAPETRETRPLSDLNPAWENEK